MFSKLFINLISLLGFGPDVITVTTGTAGVAGNVSSDLVNYLSAKLLEVAELATVMDQFGDKQPLPSNASTTIQFVREEKFTVATTPTALVEGIAPDAVGLVLNNFTATVSQYGYLTRISDLAELTARHNVNERTIYLLGLHASETYDQLVVNVLNATSTNVYRPNGRVSDVTLLATDQIGYIDLTEIEATLMGAGARPFESGSYPFVGSPQVYASLLRDPDFKASVQFGAPDRIWRGEVKELAGFRVIRSNSQAFNATAQSTSGATSTVYSSFAIGRFAYQITDLQNLRIYVAAPGGQSDTLQQSWKIGWKFAFKSLITNQNWLINVRSAGANSVNT